MRLWPLCLRVGGNCSSLHFHRRPELCPAQKKRAACDIGQRALCVCLALPSAMCRVHGGPSRSKPICNKPPGALYPSSPPKKRTRAPRDNASFSAIGKLCRLGGGVNENKSCAGDVRVVVTGSGAVGLQVQRCKAGDRYQSTPCADGAEQKRWNKQAGPAPTATVAATQAGPNTASATGQESNLGLRLISYERQPSPEACMRATHVRDSARADTTMRGDPDFMQALERAVVQACR